MKGRRGNDHVPEDALHRAILAKRHDECRELLQRKDALRLLVKNDTIFTSYVVRSGFSLLHMLCMEKVPVDIVGTIHDLQPCLAEHRDKNGRVPLHHACRNSDEQVIDLLLLKSEEPSHRRDSGRVGTDAAASRRSSRSSALRRGEISPSSPRRRPRRRRRRRNSSASIRASLWSEISTGRPPTPTPASRSLERRSVRRRRRRALPANSGFAARRSRARSRGER